jgi:hypothetical protein
MGLLYEADRRTQVELKPLVPDRAAALQAVSKRKPLEWVACVGQLQVSEAQAFIAQAHAVYVAILTAIQENKITTKTAAEAFVRDMAGPDFPVAKMLEILALNAGTAEKVATWAELVTVAKTEAI